MYHTVVNVNKILTRRPLFWGRLMGWNVVFYVILRAIKQ